MDDSQINASPPLLLAATMIVALLLFYRIIRSQVPIETKFLVLAIFLRFTASEFPAYTFISFGGFSLISILSLFTVATGVFILGLNFFVSLLAFPILFSTLAIVTSGFLNAELSAAIDASIKNVYFLIIVIAACRSVAAIGIHQTALQVLNAFFLPLVIQALAVLIGFAKDTEDESGLSYIGGYNHESGLSMVSLGATFLGLIIINKAKKIGILVICVCIWSEIMANYRTSLIAGVPLFLGAFIAFAARSVSRSERGLLPLAVLPLIALLIFVAPDFGDRFSDVTTSVTEFDRLLQNQDQYSKDEKRILSGRPYIWSGYLHSYFRGDEQVQLFGYGPGAGQREFVIYAHNTFVGALYETGLFGFLGTLGIFLGYMAIAYRSYRSKYFHCFALGYISFLILNMGTMPLWSIEGLIFFGLVVGFSAAEAYRLDSAANENMIVS
jgi:hypothetical protein